MVKLDWYCSWEQIFRDQPLAEYEGELVLAYDSPLSPSGEVRFPY